MRIKSDGARMISKPMTGTDLRRRLARFDLTQREWAELLGLSLDGLNKQMSGARGVSRQTELLLGYVEEALRREKSRFGPPPRRHGTARPRQATDKIQQSQPRRMQERIFPG
jgi:hypothetical protein